MLMKQVLKGSLITHFADSVNLLGAKSTNYENHISIWKTTPETELVASKMAPSTFLCPPFTKGLPSLSSAHPPPGEGLCGPGILQPTHTFLARDRMGLKDHLDQLQG